MLVDLVVGFLVIFGVGFFTGLAVGRTTWKHGTHTNEGSMAAWQRLRKGLRVR